MNLKIGDRAPFFHGKDQDGIEVIFGDLSERKIVLYFYPKDDTPGCTAQACNLRDNYERLVKAGYTVFGISGDDEASHRKFKAKYNLPFTLIADPDKSINKLFGVWVEKNMYGRLYFGTARTTFIIDNGIITDIISKVITADHTAQILNKGATIEKSKKVTLTKKTSSVVKPKAVATSKKDKVTSVKKVSPKKPSTVKKKVAIKPTVKKKPPVLAKPAKKLVVKKAVLKKEVVKKKNVTVAKSTTKKVVKKKATVKKK